MANYIQQRKDYFNQQLQRKDLEPALKIEAHAEFLRLKLIEFETFLQLELDPVLKPHSRKMSKELANYYWDIWDLFRTLETSILNESCKVKESIPAQFKLTVEDLISQANSSINDF